MSISKFVLIVSLTLTASATASAEPKYCQPQEFAKLKRDVVVEGSRRLRMFEVGSVTLVGAGIGSSNPEVFTSLANAAGVPAGMKSCTWYLNKSNDQAKVEFHHEYLPRPYPWSETEKTANKYQSRLEPHFAFNRVNMVECAVNHGYLAIGCDGMKHRGPSAFAMLLAYSGCSPENATTIANQTWGLNSVPLQIRAEIAKRGYELGNQNPAAREALQDAFLGGR